MYCWQRHAQEHNMGDDESRFCPSSCGSGSAYALRQSYAILTAFSVLNNDIVEGNKKIVGKSLKKSKIFKHIPIF